MTTIVVVDDHDVVRLGLCALLNAQPDFQVVGDAGGGEAAVEMVERLRPDVMVIDMVMPGINGVEVMRRVGKCAPACAVVFLSMYGAEGYVQEAIQAGAKGYVLKKDPADVLVNAIREVVVGKYYISPSIIKRVVDTYVGIGGDRVDPYQSLTNRERQVLHLLAAGNTSAQIAEKLFLSQRTVESHRAMVMSKLNLHSQQELTRYCIESGILPPAKFE